MQIKILLIFLGMLLVDCANSQIAFHNVYTSQGADRAFGVVQLEDSSFIVCGSSNSFIEGPSQAFLLKLDKFGNFEWSNSYGGNEIEEGRRVIHVPGLGYYLCGMTNSAGAGGFDAYLALINLNGTIIWERTFGGEGWERIHDAVLTSDSSIMMVGTTTSNDINDQDMYIVNCDLNGNLNWSFSIEKTGLDELNTIEYFNDSTYLIGGTIFNPDSNQTKGFISAINLNGVPYWTTQLGNNGSYYLKDFTVLQNQFVAVGSKLSNPLDHDASFFYVDFNGNQFYEAYVPGSGGFEQFTNVTSYGDSTNAFFVQAYDNSWSSPGGTDLKVTRVNIPYNPQSDYLVYHDNPDVMGEIISTFDGGIAAVGFSSQSFSGSNDVFLLKISQGNIYPQIDEQIINIVNTEEIEDLIFKAYPNPANNKLILSGLQNGLIKIFNSNGRECFSKKFSNSIEINTSEIESGFYLIKIELSDGRIGTTKMIIQH